MSTAVSFALYPSPKSLRAATRIGSFAKDEPALLMSVHGQRSVTDGSPAGEGSAAPSTAPHGFDNVANRLNHHVWPVALDKVSAAFDNPVRAVGR